MRVKHLLFLGGLLAAGACGTGSSGISGLDCVKDDEQRDVNCDPVTAQVADPQLEGQVSEPEPEG